MTYDFLFREQCPSHLCCDVINFSPQFFMKYDVIIQRPVRWYDPGKCEVTAVSPNVTSITMTSRKTRVQSKAGLCSEWISTSETHGPEEIMSLPFWFNHSVGLILQQCDTLITMISTRATYVYSICCARAQHLTHSRKTSVQNVMHLRVSIPNYKKKHSLSSSFVWCAQGFWYKHNGGEWALYLWCLQSAYWKNLIYWKYFLLKHLWKVSVRSVDVKYQGHCLYKEMLLLKFLNVFFQYGYWH